MADSDSPGASHIKLKKEALLRELAELEQLERLAAKHGIPLLVPGNHDLSRHPETAASVLVPAVYDGTLASLIQSYRAHEKSPYRDLTQKVHNNYDGTLNRLRDKIGHERIAGLSADKIKRLHEGWSEG